MKPKFPILLLILFALISSRSHAVEFVSSANYEVLPGITLMVRASPFVPSRHSIRKVKGHVIVDGHQVMGVDGTVPRTQLEEAYLIIRGHKIRLETSSLYNPWLSAPFRSSFTASWVEDEPQKEHGIDSVIRLSATFSDGAGGYTVTWRIVGDTSLRLAIEES